MARKRIAISSGGGIAAGSPFVLNGGLFVSQASPPVASTGRLARLADASLSIIAPGVLAPNSFVLGPSVVDVIGGDRSILIGRNIAQNAVGVVQASDQILIGSSITMPIGTGGQDFVIVGSNPILTTAGINFNKSASTLVGNSITLHTPGPFDNSQECVMVGYASIGSGYAMTLVGCRAKVFRLGVALGYTSEAQENCVAIGAGAVTAPGAAIDPNRAQVSVGAFAATQIGCIMVGDHAGFLSTNSYSIGIGNSAASSNIGHGAGIVGSICLGHQAICHASNMVMMGSVAQPINTVEFGAGSRQAVGGGATYTLEVTYVFNGADQKGNSLALRGGTGTGNWPNAENLGLDLQAGLLQAAGVTRQAPTSVLAIRHSDLNVALWGGLGATMGSGVKVLFVANATTAPTVAPTGGGLLYVTGGALHWLGSGGTNTAIAPA